eukprot:g11544.t1
MKDERWAQTIPNLVAICGLVWWLCLAMSMGVEVSRSVADGLVLFDDAALFAKDAQFEAFLDLVFAEACQSSSASPPAAATAAFKQCLAAALSLALEGARQDADAKTEIVRILDDQGVSQERAMLFSRYFHKNKAAIRACLKKSAFCFDTICGLEWRIDYYIKSDSYELARMPVYFITLHTRDAAGKAKDVQFTCNLQELQDLSAKLKDARNSARGTFATVFRGCSLQPAQIANFHFKTLLIIRYLDF